MTTQNTPATVEKSAYFDVHGKEIEVEGSWETVVDPESANYITWEREGVSVVGVYLSCEPVSIKGTDTFNYQLGTGPDPSVDFVEFHGTTQLDRMMIGIALGRVVRITYDGETRTADNNTFKHFTVDVVTPPSK